MNKKNYPDKAFYVVIKKMNLPDLEYFIEGLSYNKEANRDKIVACMSRRKLLLKKPESVFDNNNRLHLLANFIDDDGNAHESTPVKGNRFFGKMTKRIKKGDSIHFKDFYIELTSGLELHRFAQLIGADWSIAEKYSSYKFTESKHKTKHKGMSKSNLLFISFFDAIEKMTLPDLEQFIEGLSDDMEVNRDKMNACFKQRKSLLTEMFECTPTNLERLHCIANLINDHAKMLYDKGNQFFEQTRKLWHSDENEPFTDFYIEISLRIQFNDEQTSILHLDDDKSGSDYVRMAELLNDYYHNDYHHHGSLLIGDTLEIGANEKFEFFGHTKDRKENWGKSRFFEKFPELRELPITWEFHKLLFHTNYALQDIIRVNDVWSEVKVVRQHIYNPSPKRKKEPEKGGEIVSF